MSAVVVQAVQKSQAFVRRAFGSPRRSLKGMLPFLDQIIVSGTNFLTVILLGRLSGKDELGYYTLGFTLLVLTTALVDSMVIAPFVVFRQQLDARKRAEYDGSVLMLQGLWTLFATCILAVIVVPMTRGLWAESWILVAILPATLLREFCRRLAFATMRSYRALAMDATLSALQFAALLSLGFTQHLTAFSAYCAIGCFSAAVALGLLFWNRTEFAIHWNRVTLDLFRHWSFGRWIAAGQMLGIVHSYLSHWILGITIGVEATGEYAACMAISMLSNPLFLAMANVFGPRTALARQESLTALRQEMIKSAGILMLAMGLFTFGIFLLGRHLMQVLYGVDFVVDQTVLCLLALTIFAGGPGMVADHGLRALEKPVYAFYSSLSGLIVTAILCLILAHFYGVLGAALASLLGTVASTAVRWIAFIRIFRRLIEEPSEERA